MIDGKVVESGPTPPQFIVTKRLSKKSTHDSCRAAFFKRNLALFEKTDRTHEAKGICRRTQTRNAC